VDFEIELIGIITLLVQIAMSYPLPPKLYIARAAYADRSRCVCQSVWQVGSCIVSKRINIFSKFFTVWYLHRNAV